MPNLQMRDKAHYIVATLNDDHAEDATQVINAKNRLKFATSEEEKAAWQQKLSELKTALAENAGWLVKARECMKKDNIAEILKIGKHQGIIDD